MAEDIWYEGEGGLRLYAREYGDPASPTKLLMMHGLTRNHRDFIPLIAALGDGFHIVAVDQRGRGRSQYDTQPERYAVPTYAMDMNRLLDKLGWQRVILIGTSMGGLMSMVMMTFLAPRIEGVVLNDIGPELEQAGLDRIAGYVGGAPSVATWEDAAARTATVQSSAFPHFEPADWMDFARRTWRQTDDGRIVLDYDTAISASLAAIKVTDEARAAGWELFKAMYAVPLLIVRGEISDLFSAQTARRMIELHPDAAEVVAPGIGHAPILDEPPVAAAITDFIRKIEKHRP